MLIIRQYTSSGKEHLPKRTATINHTILNIQRHQLVDDFASNQVTELIV